MAESIDEYPTSAAPIADQPLPRRRGLSRNLLRYTLKRLAMLALTVVAAVYLTILIANYGGHVDAIVSAKITERSAVLARNEPFVSMPPDERMAALEETLAAMRDAAGLNDPFLLRTVQWLGDGLTLNWGRPARYRAYSMSASGFTTTAGVVRDHLSRTLLVFGLANLCLFFASLFLGLLLNRRRGGLLDSLFILLSPISSAPAWVYGVLLSVFALRAFGFSPGGAFNAWEGGLQLNQIVVVLRHLALPFLAIFLAGLFQTVYTWRSFFQIYSDEDYVEMAHARGLSPSRIDRDYIIRPALPGLLTRFGLLLAVLWQEVIALEYFFNVQGLGRLFVEALNSFDTPMIVTIVTVFAYLIAITVFLLDLCYVLVDPRVRIGGRRAAARQRTAVASWTTRILRSLPRPTRRGLAASLYWLASIPRALSPVSVATGLVRNLRKLLRYPSAIFRLAVITFLFAVSIYTVIAIPYEQAVALWRGDDDVWIRNPRQALPAWVNLFRRDDLPPTLTFDSTAADSAKEVAQLDGDLADISMPFTFQYDYGGFPQDIILDISAPYDERGPHITLTWVWPDGSERELTGFKPRTSETYYFSHDDRLQRRLDSERPLQALFLDPQTQDGQIIKGTYTLRVDALLFEPDTDVDVQVTMLGQVYGLAGTDSEHRDLMIALLWGTPVALVFGLVAAFLTSVGAMLFAALGAWYGGLVDRAVQFLTETNLILPFFPVSLMVLTMYSRSIITILAVTVALTLFGSAVKTYRAIFLQVRTEPYIEAARAYGAGDWRIVVRYMLPRIVTLLIPRLIILVPGYVFLEATLAFLGVSDPLLPTWGKLVVAALSSGIHSGATHIVLAPLGVLFLTGFAFAMLGLALERLFESRLTGV